MDAPEIVEKFESAFRAAVFTNGRVANTKEVERLIRPALEAMGYHVEQNEPFYPPYRIEEKEDGVFLIPHIGRRMSITDTPLHNGVNQIKYMRQVDWEQGIHRFINNIENRDLKDFIFSFMGNNRLGVKLRKQTGHLAVSEVVNTLKEHYESVDPDIRSLAGHVYSKLTYGRYAEVKRRKAEFVKFSEEGAMGARHLFPEIRNHGFFEMIDAMCSIKTHVALKDKGIRYFYNIFDEIKLHLDSVVHEVDFGPALKPYSSKKDEALIDEIRNRLSMTIDGLNQVVKMTGKLPPEPLMLSFFKLDSARHNKAFVAAGKLFVQGRQRMRDLLSLEHNLVSISNEDRVDVDGFCAIANRKIDYRLAMARKPESFGIGEILFVFQKKNTLLAYYHDPETGLNTCKKIRRDFLTRFQGDDLKSIQVKDVIDAPGFFDKARNERIQSRPSCLFSLVGTKHSLKLYTSSPQGRRMLASKDGDAFLKRVAVSAIRRFDEDLLQATLTALAERKACLHPDELQAGTRAWLMIGDSGKMLRNILSQPALMGYESRCLEEKWLEQALTSQASPCVVEEIIGHLNGGVSEKTLSLFGQYHVQSNVFNSFIHACKMREIIQNGTEENKIDSDLMSREPARSRPVYARMSC